VDHAAIMSNCDERAKRFGLAALTDSRLCSFIEAHAGELRGHGSG
jgi:hypothetical protein